jgi:hypothetical protein
MEKNYELPSLNNELDVRAVPHDEERISLFMSLTESGVYLPPIEVYAKENRLFIKDGRHRVEAYRRMGKKSILGVEVPYTSLVQMSVDALASNMTKKGAPLPPTEKDFRKVIWTLSKEGVDKLTAIKMFEKIGVPSAFAKKMVNQTFHSLRKLNELHATESVRDGRMSVVEASTHYNVKVDVIKRKLAAVNAYGLPYFGLDAQKKIKAFQNFTIDKLKTLEGLGGRPLAGEAIKTILRKEIEKLKRWVDAQEVAYR